MAFITSQEVKKARKIANTISREYGFKVSTTKYSYCGINVNLMEGKKITIDDLNINGYMRNFIESHGTSSFENIESFEEWFRLYGGGMADIHHEWSLYSRISNLIDEGQGSLHLFKDGSNIKNMAKLIEDKIKIELKYHNKNNSMIDYYDEKFYYDFEVGKWNKPYKTI